MFYKFDENGRVISSSNIQLDPDFIEIDFTHEEIEKLNNGFLYKDGDFIESDESKNFDKETEIKSFKEIEKKATEKRSEYLTAEMLPEGVFKDMKLEKIIKEGDEIKAEYEIKIQELISKYGEEILQELL